MQPIKKNDINQVLGGKCMKLTLLGSIFLMMLETRHK